MSDQILCSENNLEFNDLNCKKELTDVLYFLYKNDKCFPRSCGAVSMALAFILHDKGIKDMFNIKYIRGHYRNDYEEVEGECYVESEDDFVRELEYNRYSDLKSFDCQNCTCDYMIGHSWIELESKNDSENIILDFTSIQLEEDFCDYHAEILESNFNKDELFDYIEKRSKFIIYPNDSRYKQYIKSEREVESEYIRSQALETLNDGLQSDLIVILSAINYKI